MSETNGSGAASTTEPNLLHWFEVNEAVMDAWLRRHRWQTRFDRLLGDRTRVQQATRALLVRLGVLKQMPLAPTENLPDAASVTLASLRGVRDAAVMFDEYDALTELAVLLDDGAVLEISAAPFAGSRPEGPPEPCAEMIVRYYGVEEAEGHWIMEER